jgi:hypothetical protein
MCVHQHTGLNILFFLISRKNLRQIDERQWPNIQLGQSYSLTNAVEFSVEQWNSGCAGLINEHLSNVKKTKSMSRT